MPKLTNKELQLILQEGEGYKIEFKEKEVEKKVYYFEVNQSQIDEIESGDKNAILRLEFVDDEENKMADKKLIKLLTCTFTAKRYT